MRHHLQAGSDSTASEGIGSGNPPVKTPPQPNKVCMTSAELDDFCKDFLMSLAKMPTMMMQLILMLMAALQQVIITTENVDVGTVDNQENVEPDNRKDPARFAIFRQILQNFMAILMTALITTLMTTLTLSRMTDLELKRRNRRESNQIQKTQEGMVSTYIMRTLT